MMPWILCFLLLKGWLLECLVCLTSTQDVTSIAPLEVVTLVSVSCKPNAFMASTSSVNTSLLFSKMSFIHSLFPVIWVTLTSAYEHQNTNILQIFEKHEHFECLKEIKICRASQQVWHKTWMPKFFIPCGVWMTSFVGSAPSSEEVSLSASRLVSVSTVWCSSLI